MNKSAKFHDFVPDWKVVFHMRRDIEGKKDGTKLMAPPGKLKAFTVVVLFGKNNLVAHGAAACGRKDYFNRRLAREIATERAKKVISTPLKDPWKGSVWPHSTVPDQKRIEYAARIARDVAVMAEVQMKKPKRKEMGR